MQQELDGTGRKEIDLCREVMASIAVYNNLTLLFIIY